MAFFKIPNEQMAELHFVLNTYKNDKIHLSQRHEAQKFLLLRQNVPKNGALSFTPFFLNFQKNELR